MKLNVFDPVIREEIKTGGFGLEKESLRVTPDGHLSHTPHPFDDPRMDKDFCENQTELITGVNHSIDEVCDEMDELHRKAVKTLLNLESGPEYLWPFSNPPYVNGEDDVPIAGYTGNFKDKGDYREYLANKYGKKKMLLSGIHFNYSFSEKLLLQVFADSEFENFKDFKNQFYLDLAAKVTRYGWLIVYLTAASSVLDGSYFDTNDMGKDIVRRYASTRCSDIGYWNTFVPNLDYSNIETYAASIQRYIDNGELRQASELYYPVRLKPKGDNSLNNLLENGINHIELRTLDLNPFVPTQIHRKDVGFFHVLLIYLAAMDDKYFGSYEQVMAIQNEKNAAKYNESGIQIQTAWAESVPITNAVLLLLFDMERFFKELGEEEFVEAVLYQEEKILHPDKRYAVRLRKEVQPHYVEKGLKLAKKYAGMVVNGEDIEADWRHDEEY